MPRSSAGLTFLWHGTCTPIYYADREDRRGESRVRHGRRAARAWIKDLALATRMDVQQGWVLRLEGHFLNGLPGAPDGAQEDWMVITTELSISF